MAFGKFPSFKSKKPEDRKHTPMKQPNWGGMGAQGGFGGGDANEMKYEARREATLTDEEVQKLEEGGFYNRPISIPQSEPPEEVLELNKWNEDKGLYQQERARTHKDYIPEGNGILVSSSVTNDPEYNSPSSTRAKLRRLVSGFSNFWKGKS